MVVSQQLLLVHLREGIMQQWEYCAVGPIKTESSWWYGSYPKLYYFNYNVFDIFTYFII